MTLQARITWWTASLLLGALLILLGFAYFEFVHEHPELFRGPGPVNQTQLAESLEEFALSAGVPFLIIGLGGIGWLLFVRQALRPLQQLTEAAERVHAGNLREPLPRSGNNDEIDRLAAVLNETHRHLDEAFAQVREFTLHASHELKTPLSILHHGLETTLRDEQLSDHLRERTAAQLEEVQRLARIVDDLTLLTKAGVGALKLVSVPVAFDQLVRDVTEDTRVLADESGIAVLLEVCEATMILGDSNRLRQLLINLADNAVKHNHPGGRVVFVLLRSNNNAILTVTNTGAGLSPALQGRVFDRFFRGDPAHGRSVDGTGLGLSIAQLLVAAHRGTICFESIENQTTTVTVTLPLTSVGNNPLG